MFNSKSLVVGLLAVVAVLAGANFQVLANHTADVWVRINYVRVLGDTDGFGAGCPDPYVKMKITSTVAEVRERQTSVIGGVCPVRTIFRNQWYFFTPVGHKITTGPFQLSYSVKDEDDFSADDTMNSGAFNNIPCDNRYRTFTDFAGAGDAADVQFTVLCRPIAHARIASEFTLSSLGKNGQTAQLRVFNALGRKVLDLAETGQSLESLSAKAQGHLANGIYLALLTQQDATGKIIVQKVQRLVILH